MTFVFFIKAALVLILVYIVLGFLFAFAFVFIGVNRIDEGAGESSWGFRLMIFPGTVLLWPILLKKWLQSKSAGS